MPAKVGDPVNVALRLSLAAGDAPGDLEKRLVSTATQVLSAKVEYEKSNTFNSSILDALKHKYVRINADCSISNGRPGTPRLLPDASVSREEMRPEPDSVLPTPKVILFPAERVQLGWRGNYPVGSGMLNVGNTCYLNATLQALFHIPALVNWLQGDSNHLNKCTVAIANGSLQSECLICAMNKTLKASQKKSGNVIKPYLIISRLKFICKHFGHGQQEDAHEFLRYLIENMGEAFLVRFRGENLDSYSKETTPLNQILGGYMRTEVTCLQCRGVSTTFQHFQELLLDIRRASTLDDALTAYFQRERLDGDDAYRCERCHKKVSATKKFSIEKPPHVLCIQLKRFSVVGVKLNKHVSFTQRLDLTRFLCPQSSHRPAVNPLTYKLVSMVTHMGSSVHCGHYTAIAQTSSGHFYHFDDSSVRPISLNAALDTNTYIIIYEMERLEGCPQQSFTPSSKPATITSGAPLFNGTAPRSISVTSPGLKAGPILSPVLPRPGPSVVPAIHKQPSLGIIPVVHKPNVLLPPAKDRDRVTFGLQQPRLVMHIKNGKVCQPPTPMSGPKSSLVPYESGDSSDSDSEKKPDMPVLEASTPVKQATAHSEINLPLLVKQTDSGKSPSSFHRKSEVSSPRNKTLSSFDLLTKTPLPKVMELTTKVQKCSVKSPSSGNSEFVVVEPASSKSIEHCMMSPAKLLSDSFITKTRKVEVESSVRRKIFDTADTPSKCVSEVLQVNTSLPSGSRGGGGKPANWQVTDVSLHSPSCHSESSTNSVASSTTSWAVSDVKRTPKRPPSYHHAPSTPTPTPDKMRKYASDLEISPRLERCLAVSPQKPPWQVSKSVVHRREETNAAPDPKIETTLNDWNQNVETKALPHCNGSAGKGNDESDEYEWVEKTQESLGLARCNGQLNGWEGKNRGEVISHLMRHSHQGYGASVNSWTGGRAHVDRELDSERRDERKRAFNKQYDEELDMGRVKKMKHRDEEFDENSHKTNHFDEYRKSWSHFRGTPYYDSHHSGRMFHNNNKKYRTNNNHYNNGYYRRKHSTQHHRGHYSGKQDRWRR